MRSVQNHGPATVAVRYIAFAVIAGGLNLGAQAATYAAAPPAPLTTSMLVGTGVGFVVKYLLDKRFIFFDAYHSPAAESRKIIFYAAFSVATTAIFWAFEVGFFVLFESAAAKYVGAALGLAIGNALKYLLDRDFTFSRRASGVKPRFSAAGRLASDGASRHGE